MITGNSSGEGWTKAAASAAVAGLAIGLGIWWARRQTNRAAIQNERTEFELDKIRTELAQLRADILLLKDGQIPRSQSGILRKERNVSWRAEAGTEGLPRPWSYASSMTSDGEYVDAEDEWNEQSLTAQLTVNSALKQSDFEEIDAWINSDGADKAYDALKKRSDETNVEVLWRLAKCCNELANKLESKDERKTKILEGRQYALDAYNGSQKHFLAAKWAAIMTGQLTNYVGTKERTELGIVMKGYQDEALTMNPKDYALLHLRGRFAFTIANLSWIEKKAASVLFATLPNLTLDDALSDFLAAYELNAEWLENLVYIGRCYAAKKDKSSAKKYFAQATAIQPADAAEAELHQEAQNYVNKN